MHSRNHYTIYFFVMLLIIALTQPVLSQSYADDRAEIENLMARYMFALDFRDVEGYAGTFTEDGILNHGGGVEKGRDEIRTFMINTIARDRERAANDTTGLRPKPARHIVTNMVINIDGDNATARAYWIVFTGQEDRRGRATAYGHYEDELKRVNGKWLFSKRMIYNEYWDGREYGVYQVEDN